MFKLFLYNTISGKREEFKPDSNDKVVKMYVCGITPYDYSHLGHGRVYVTFDFFYRFLKFLGYKVNYCRNFTDIDDKILKRAEEIFQDESRYKEIPEKFIDAFYKDMEALNCLKPDFEPKVTENIEEIIDFVQGLINSGHAYQVGGDVYFSVKSFPEYGKLSKRNLEDMLAGARVSINEKKRDPMDFALWKSADEDSPGWDSPWGRGRPGWHIECSTLAKKYLGEQIDIHGGGMDLIFPHHENEIAQSEALTKKPFSKFWMHNAFLQVNKEKMSKSLGNFLFLYQVFEKFDPMVLRYFYLQHQYRNPINFDANELEGVKKSYQRLVKLFENTPDIEYSDLKIFEKEMKPEVKEMIDFLCDDLNTPGFFGVIFKNFKKIQNNIKFQEQVKYLLINVLGLSLESLPEEVELTDDIKELIKQREEARVDKDWATADAIRDKLKKMGVELQDKKL